MIPQSASDTRTLGRPMGGPPFIREVVMDGPIVASSREFDLSIGVRLEAQARDGLAEGRIVQGAFVALGWKVKDWESVYQEDRRRFGKAKAGHYTTIVR